MFISILTDFFNSRFWFITEFMVSMMSVSGDTILSYGRHLQIVLIVYLLVSHQFVMSFCLLHFTAKLFLINLYINIKGFCFNSCLYR